MISIQKVESVVVLNLLMEEMKERLNSDRLGMPAFI